MPVKIGDNLTLEDNKLSAVYKELYTKLNRAYAWTNTIDLSSGGSAICINGLSSSTSPNIITSLSINSGDNISISDYKHTETSVSIFGIIINGEIYYRPTIDSFIKIGNNNNYIKLAATGNVSSTSGNYHIYAINSNGELYDINYNKSTSTWSETQIGSDTDWNSFCGISGDYVGILKNKKLYTLHNGTPTLNTTYQNYNFDKLICMGSSSGTLPTGSIALMNNNLYCFKTSFQQLGNVQIKDFDHVLAYSPTYCTCAALDVDDNWYIVTFDKTSSSDNKFEKIGSDLLKCKIVNTFFSYSYTDMNILKITSDYKLYYGGGNLASLNQICPSIRWKDAIGTYIYAKRPGYPLYAISTEGELYLISNSTTATKISDSTGFQKLIGFCCNSTTPSFGTGLILALNYGDEGQIKSTLYTTKNPIVNDYAYVDNVGNYTYSIDNSIITNVNSNNSITVNNKIYNRDMSKDSSFTFTPSATIRDTITVAEILAATNPNN